MRQRNLSAHWVRAILDGLAGSGLDVDSLCREAGLDLTALTSPNYSCPTEQVSLLWEAAVARSGNPAIGLTLRNVAGSAALDVVGYAMMSSENLSVGLERFARYVRMIGDCFTVTLTRQGEECRLDYEVFGGNRPVPRQRIESSLLIFLTFCRWIAGQELHPKAIEFSYGASVELPRYQEAFGCPVRFNAPSNCMVFSNSDLTLPLPTANPKMAELLDRFAGERIEQLDNTQVTFKVRELIIRQLPDGEPGREGIAGKLCVSERTLQRQLREEGTSYQQLLDQTRRELATRYLGQPQLALAEAAYLLGFAEQSNFTRACKRWFQLSPGQYRARQVNL